MKFILIYLSLLLSLTALGQDSISITISGKAFEAITNENISNTRFETKIFGKDLILNKWITTDDKGSFSLKLKVPSNQNNLSFDCNAEKSGYGNHYISRLVTNGKDTAVVFNMGFKREKICKDTWLPSPLFFAKNNCDSVIDSYNEIKTLIDYYKSNLKLFNDKKLIVSVYHSFSEKSKVSKCRAEKIKTIILENGLKENQFEIKTEGKKEFTYYYYPSGCHTEQEFKEHIVLSKSAYKKASSEQKKEMDKLRQSIIFSWENK